MESKTDIALIKKDIKYLRDGIDEIKNTLNCGDKKYVQKLEFDLVNEEQNKRIGKMETMVNRIIWGVAIFVLSAVGKGLLDLMINVKASN
jgi:hypothetical protein